MIIKVFHTLQQSLFSLKEWLDWFLGINFYIRDNFGVFAQIVLCIFALYFVILLVTKLVKAILHLVFYIILPSFVLSLLASLFISYSFFNILPFFVCLMMGINLVRVLK
ncbi:MAG: hypothetical protein OEV55_10425 [candidate division Zixibacteria bacterium]|nr:hypothetical protein [candidate division Zixibacteria bacterium]